MRRFVYYNASSAGASLLLDLYPAVAAYSVRKLRTAYTGACMRVRRSSDNMEQDIGFVGEDLDTVALLSFVGAGNGLITKWYNQGSLGSTADVEITSAGNQHSIVVLGVLNQVNSRPASNSGLLPPYVLGSRIDGIRTFFGVNKINVQNTLNYLWFSESGGQVGGVFQNGNFATVNGIGGFNNIVVRSLTGEDLLQNLAYVNLRSGNFYAAKNGAAESNLGTFSASFSLDEIFGRGLISNLYFQGSGQEMIFFTTDESNNKTAIETNINNYYGIYP